MSSSSTDAHGIRATASTCEQHLRCVHSDAAQCGAHLVYIVELNGERLALPVGDGLLQRVCSKGMIAGARSAIMSGGAAQTGSIAPCAQSACSATAVR